MEFVEFISRGASGGLAAVNSGRHGCLSPSDVIPNLLNASSMRESMKSRSCSVYLLRLRGSSKYLLASFVLIGLSEGYMQLLGSAY